MKNKCKKNEVGYFMVMTTLLPDGGNNNTDKNLANQKLIKAYYTAYEKDDWSLLNSILAEEFIFNSPNDDHIDLETYKERCWPNAINTERFDIEKLIVDGDDAFVTYNGFTTDGRVFRNTEYFKFKDGKIIENACYFGPGVSFPNNTDLPGI